MTTADCEAWNTGLPPAEREVLVWDGISYSIWESAADHSNWGMIDGGFYLEWEAAWVWCPLPQPPEPSD